jgi:hypothetical protein
VWVNGRGPIHFRDLTPKDFYYVQILQNEKLPESEVAIAVLARILLDEEPLEQLSIGETRHTFEWAMENLLSAKIMSVEGWLQTAFHLCKQRWDSSIEWMETLPVPKILLMIDILNQHIKAEEAEMKKAAKKR